MLVLNFKGYSEALGQKAFELAKTASEVSDETGVRIIVSPAAADLLRVSDKIETFAQHTDPVKPGSRTGSLLAKASKEAGATGSLLNHSERRIQKEDIKKSINILKELNMTSIVCTQTPEESEEYAKLNPDYIAVEPPELIGSGVSVSTSKPEIITDSVKKVKNANSDVKVLCGAGISNGSDIKKALELGAEGVLLASAFVKADNPKQILKDMAGGFSG
ncbi:MAG: triose-phosphate isomerase [Candidatus Undinarchaeales archaeon]